MDLSVLLLGKSYCPHKLILSMRHLLVAIVENSGQNPLAPANRNSLLIQELTFPTPEKERDLHGISIARGLVRKLQHHKICKGLVAMEIRLPSGRFLLPLLRLVVAKLFTNGEKDYLILTIISIELANAL